VVGVLHQRAVTHTQAFCGAVAAGLAVLAKVTDDAGLRAAVVEIPEHAAAALEAAREWPEDAGALGAEAAVAFGSGPAWAAALEAALLLKEVACIPAEGVETREGATSAMMALRPGHLALSLPTAAEPLLDEAEEICAARGATVLRAPVPDGVDRRLASIVSHPASVALAERLGLARGLDVDRPAWTEDYYRVARSSG
jgi:glucosamine--fructose-6-phosphate aminotransferase (isomerizing)